ncbi:GDSL esterase/lipase At5g45960-like [Nicotiana tomentosiformis]|uniref:GDSL esterase/lipase At5g45960-like n=1 Tax=Nicotiana tomentosiformis TaxID=4098 RepID=UPI00051BDA16|nr:GDSL esterase/lipase At5g45960-like [Nicotiana tomentosiformis]
MHLSLFFLLLLHLLFPFFMLEAPTQAQGKSLVSAIFIFGDSTADPGNNNYITTPFKSNFSPYGRDFTNHVPTGRFTNGMLANDFFARYVGVKEYVPPYLDPSLSIEELKSGVSFASAGTGFDPLTPTISNVISLSKQLEYFKEYQEKLEAAIGKEQTQNLIKEALFIVSAGTNDFVVNYNTLPIRRKSYSLSSYTDFLLQHAQLFLQELLDQGARKIGVVGLPPMGCLPVVITLHSDNAFTKRDCTDFFSSIARDYNSKLQNQLNDIQFKFAKLGSRIAYMGIYGPLVDMILGRKYDFEKTNSGCCGTGLLEASFMCNPKSYVCSNATKYVFWDSIHPTEKTYYLISQALQPTIDYITKY